MNLDTNRSMALGGNIKFVGTSHIAKQSIEEIKRQVGEFQPDILAVELDAERAAALLGENKQKRSPLQQLRAFGAKGYLFAQLGHYIQQKLGKKVGISPGSEMKTALEIAKKQKIEVALIDQPIRLTLKKFSRSFTWKERWHFLQDVFGSIFCPKRQLKKWKLTHFDLKTVPPEEIITELIENVRERYPSLYKILIEERNKYMVQKLVQLMRQDKEKKVLVVVGAGHKKGMEELLKKESE